MDAKLMALIDTAIRREEEAYAFYRELRGRVADDASRETIDWIAGEEKKHKEFLEQYRQGGFGSGELRLAEPVYYRIAEHQEEPAVREDMSRPEVFLIAAHRELRSHRFYRALAAEHGEGPAREMLARMATEELRHKEKMEYLYANAAFPQTSGG
ncbi:MAG: ferritin family protein [Desulfobacterales bacterium]